jgi:Holliday junction resolvase RusA-like endonuclease
MTKAGHCYTDAKTTTARQDVRAAAALAYRGQPLEGPLSVAITALRYKPKSWPKSRWAWSVKPDWDNLGKLVCDACKGILWRDDAQIVDGRVCKAQSGMVEGFLVTVGEADETMLKAVAREAESVALGGGGSIGS